MANQIERCMHHLDSAKRRGDRSAEASALQAIGEAYLKEGKPTVAVTWLQESVSVHADVGDLVGEDTAVSNLGAAYIRQGNWDRAVDALTRSITLARQTGDR